MSIVEQTRQIAHPRGASGVASHGSTLPPITPHLPASAELRDVLAQVGERIAPVWPLRDYVAVNPWSGLADHHWLDARQELQAVSDREMLLPLEYYRTRFRQQKFGLGDIDAAIDEMLRDGLPGAAQLSTADIARQLQAEVPQPKVPPADTASTVGSQRLVETISETVDRYSGTDWTPLICDEIGKLCSAHYDQGQSAWPSPWRELSLYEAWRKQAVYNRRARWMGLRSLRALVAAMPADALEAVAWALERLEIPAELWEKVLLCEALSIGGWSAWTRYKAVQAEREGGENRDFIGLLAIRLTWDLAVAEATGWNVCWSTAAAAAIRTGASGRDAAHGDQALLRCCLLRASEIAHRRQLLGKLARNRKSNAAQPHVPFGTPPKPAVLAQLVFCIDVRSERIRRRLEASSEEIQTFGFAGFFGLPIEYVPFGEQTGRSHTPALLSPQFKVREGVPSLPAAASADVGHRRSLVRQFRKAWKGFQGSIASACGFVETCGLFYGPKLLQRAWGGGQPVAGCFDGLEPEHRPMLGPVLDPLPATNPQQLHQPHPPQSGNHLADGTHIAMDVRVDLAHGILTNLGLVSDFAPLVVFCGHGSETTNNPLQAGLDCGACCGHSGEPNARLAALLLNDPVVRQAIKERGIEIPADTFFLAALHNTTTDELQFFGESTIPPSHLDGFELLKCHAQHASLHSRYERQATLAAKDQAELFCRATDWSEVRPEWGLAGNASFVIGPRHLTKDASLDARAFLHCYDPQTDPEGVVLERIMTAPMIVTHWINMQYYASVVDNRHYGSGSKTIHNVVGQFGIVAGNGGDLTTGLPWQSLHDGTQLVHEPLRLQVVIAASRQTVQQIIARHPDIADLLKGAWMHLVVLEGDRVFRYTCRQSWLPVHVPAS
jgi:uncharacterized protein